MPSGVHGLAWTQGAEDVPAPLLARPPGCPGQPDLVPSDPSQDALVDEGLESATYLVRIDFEPSANVRHGHAALAANHYGYRLLVGIQVMGDGAGEPPTVPGNLDPTPTKDDLEAVDAGSNSASASLPLHVKF